MELHSPTAARKATEHPKDCLLQDDEGARVEAEADARHEPHVEERHAHRQVTRESHSPPPLFEFIATSHASMQVLSTMKLIPKHHQSFLLPVIE